MVEQTYKIRFKTGSSEIEIEGDKIFVEEKLSFLLKEIKSNPTTVNNAEPSTQRKKVESIGASTSAGEKPQIKAFIAEKQPNSGVKIATVIAYYLFKFEGKNTFVDDDIKKLWIASGCKPPKALHQMLIDCKNEKGWFDFVSRGTYKINEHGIYFVEYEMPEKKR
jgi:hypothetical protein